MKHHVLRLLEPITIHQDGDKMIVTGPDPKEAEKVSSDVTTNKARLVVFRGKQALLYTDPIEEAKDPNKQSVESEPSKESDSPKPTIVTYPHQSVLHIRTGPAEDIFLNKKPATNIRIEKSDSSDSASRKRHLDADESEVSAKKLSKKSDDGDQEFIKNDEAKRDLQETEVQLPKEKEEGHCNQSVRKKSTQNTSGDASSLKVESETEVQTTLFEQAMNNNTSESNYDESESEGTKKFFGDSQTDFFDSEISVGQSYPSHLAAKMAVKKYGSDTNQYFVIGPGCAKTSKNHSLRRLFPFSSVRFVCTHGGSYKAHRKGMKPTIRTKQTTIKMNCPAEIRMKLIKGEFEVVAINTDHNHPVNETIYNYYPAVRRFSEDERETVLMMLESGITPKVIVKSINSKRVKNGRKGIAITKDVLNLSYSAKKTHKETKSDTEMLIQHLEELKNQDQTGIYEAHVPDVSGISNINVIYLQKGEMLQTMEKYPESLHVDVAHKLNIEKFCLVAFIVVDSTGSSKPVSIGFLKDDSQETFKHFCQTFKAYNPAWANVKSIFVRRDFYGNNLLQSEFLHSNVLLCAASVLKSFKANLAKENLPPGMRRNLTQLFEKVMFSRKMSELKRNENLLLRSCSKRIMDFYNTNWGYDHSNWCFAYREDGRIFDKSNISHTEKFFLSVRANLGKNEKSLSECVKLVMASLTDKKNQMSYKEFRNKVTTMKLHKFPEIADAVGLNVIQSAASIIKEQCELFTNETYFIEDESPDVWSVSNQSTGQKYQVEMKNQMLTCSCYVNCTQGIPCRHIFSVRKSRGEGIFQVVDVNHRWLRQSNLPEATTTKSEWILPTSETSSSYSEVSCVSPSTSHISKSPTKIIDFNKRLKSTLEVSQKIAL